MPRNSTSQTAQDEAPQVPENETEAPKTVETDIRAHLADPANVPLPEGVVINFGDPERFRVVKD